MKWKGGKLESAAIHALKDGLVNIRYAERTATISVKPGQTVHLSAALATTN